MKLFDGVEVLIFDPLTHEANRAAIVYYHGGGWRLFNPSNRLRFFIGFY